MTCDKKLTNRLKRVQGQVQAALKASEQSEIDCVSLTTQLQAIKGAIEQAILYVTTNNLKLAINNAENIDEALELMSKNIR